MEQRNHSGIVKSCRQMSESYSIGILLALSGGFLDAYTYVSRDRVFANAQTGNILLMGMNLAEGKLSAAFRYFIPILAFIAGVVLVEIIKERYRDSKNGSLHWRQIIIATEIAVLAVVAFVPSGPWNLAVNTAISFVCSMQVESFPKVRGNAYATTMCTGNLRSAAEQMFYFFKTGNRGAGGRAMQYYGIILMFILGAVCGMYATRIAGELAVLLCCALLSAVFIMMFWETECIENSAGGS